MTLTSELRERLAAVFSAAVGLAVAATFIGFTVKALPSRDAKPIRLSQGVRFAAAVPKAAPAAPEVPLPVQTPDAPKQKQPKKRPQPVQPAQPVTPQPPSDAPVVEASNYQLPAQLMAPSAPASAPEADLPMLPGQMTANASDAKPSAPPDDYAPPQQEYLETPGGDVLVLGLLVDHRGKVLKSQVLVPSWDDLKNYTLAIVGKDITFSEVNPPLAPGETRWLEVKYVIPQHKPGILP